MNVQVYLEAFEVFPNVTINASLISFHFSLISSSRNNFVSSFVGRLEETHSTATPVALPLVSFDPILLEAIDPEVLRGR